MDGLVKAVVAARGIIQWYAKLKGNVGVAALQEARRKLIGLQFYIAEEMGQARRDHKRCYSTRRIQETIEKDRWYSLLSNLGASETKARIAVKDIYEEEKVNEGLADYLYPIWASIDSCCEAIKQDISTLKREIND